MSCMLLLCSVFTFGCTANNAEVGKNITISESENIPFVANAVLPAIVGISGNKDNGQSVGSGVCVSESGHILTNSHVINGCNHIVLYLSDKSQTGADIIYEDTVLDLAILKADKNLPYLSLGDSDELSLGEDILAVGTPLSLTLVHTFTKGIVSALNRTLKVSNSNGEGYMQNLIQHDASLNPGNSGGPLLNTKGEVVGINTLKISSGEGIGFAIPSKSFKSLLGSFVQKINYAIPYLGVYGFDNEIANYYGKTNFEKGFYVLDISDNSPLKAIGVENGSVILKLNGHDINNTLDLKDKLYSCQSGEDVEIEYFKDGNYYSGKTQLK